MKKREKELARAQKQRDKAAKRQARKNGLLNPEDAGDADAGSMPEDEDASSSSSEEPQASSSLTTSP